VPVLFMIGKLMVGLLVVLLVVVVLKPELFHVLTLLLEHHQLKTIARLLNQRLFKVVTLLSVLLMCGPPVDGALVVRLVVVVSALVLLLVLI